jgi:hypothetical protein
LFNNAKNFDLFSSQEQYAKQKYLKDSIYAGVVLDL